MTWLLPPPCLYNNEPRGLRAAQDMSKAWDMFPFQNGWLLWKTKKSLVSLSVTWLRSNTATLAVKWTEIDNNLPAAS
jgi:hypothetical protein